jgi:hypothetical protein
MLVTLGDVVTCALALAAVALVPLAIVRAWWPQVRAWMGRLYAQSVGLIMSRRDEAAAREADTAAVHVLVQTDQYVPPIEDGWQPRLPRYPTEEELVIYLATIKDRQGTYLRSANKIAEFSTLHRNEVLRLVRAVRDGVTEYSAPLTPEQAELRDAMHLPR